MFAGQHFAFQKRSTATLIQPSFAVATAYFPCKCLSTSLRSGYSHHKRATRTTPNQQRYAAIIAPRSSTQIATLRSPRLRVALKRATAAALSGQAQRARARLTNGHREHSGSHATAAVQLFRERRFDRIFSPLTAQPARQSSACIFLVAPRSRSRSPANHRPDQQRPACHFV